MPSDRHGSGERALAGRTDRALTAVGPALEAFRSAVGRAVDEVRSQLVTRAETGGTARAEAELGPLSRGRIDTERFAALFEGAEALDPGAAERMREALDVLAELDAAGEEAFAARVEPGGDLAGTVTAALARLGRAFGAARIAELARSGRLAEGEREGWLEAFPPTMWNRSERDLAPPLVVEVRGEELRPAPLVDVLDGGQTLALVVEGTAPPAPLVRLVSPGVLVLQTDDPGELSRLADHEGPAVGALYPDGARFARFLHDPAGGDSLPDRLEVGDLPREAELRPVGAITASRQAEELGQLGALASLSAAAAVPSENGSATPPGREREDEEPADRLAAWLLRQANLRELG